MKFTISIANRNIYIDSVFTNIYHLSKDYLVKGDVPPDIEIVVDEKKLEDEYERIVPEIGEDLNLKTVERFYIHRIVAESLLSYDTFLMHGAVISVNGYSYLFTAPSGTGKTTHIRKWLDNAKGSYVVNGDKPFILADGEEVLACGSPWRGKENMGTNAIVPLKSIIFMERSTINFIEPISFGSALPLLLQQTYHPKEVDAMKKTLNLLFKLKGSVSFYMFHFNNYRDDAFSVSYKMLVENQDYSNEGA